MIKPFILRRDKKSVLQDLPEKLETNYYMCTDRRAEKIYLAYLRQMREEIAQMDTAAFRKIVSASWLALLVCVKSAAIRDCLWKITKAHQVS